MKSYTSASGAQPGSTSARLLRRTSRALLLIFIYGGLIYCLTKVDLRSVWGMIRNARPADIGLAVLLTFVMILFKTSQWRSLLNRAGPFFHLLKAINLWLVADHILPFKSADLVKIELVSRATGLTRSRVTGGLVIEALLGSLTFLSLLIFVALSAGRTVILVGPGGPSDGPAGTVGRLDGALEVTLAPTLAMTGAATLATAALIFLSRFVGRLTAKSPWSERMPRWFPRIDRSPRIKRFLEDLASGISLIRDRRALPVAFLYGIGFKLAEGLVLWEVQRALGLALPFPATLFVLISIGLALTIPVSVGNVGTFELAAIGAYSLVGIPMAQALPAALVFHAVLVVPTVLSAGLMLLVPEDRLALGTTASQQDLPLSIEPN